MYLLSIWNGKKHLNRNKFLSRKRRSFKKEKYFETMKWLYHWTFKRVITVSNRFFKVISVKDKKEIKQLNCLHHQQNCKSSISLFAWIKESLLLCTKERKKEKKAPFLPTSYPETDEEVRYLGELFIFLFQSTLTNLFIFYFIFCYIRFSIPVFNLLTSLVHCVVRIKGLC